MPLDPPPNIGASTDRPQRGRRRAPQRRIFTLPRLAIALTLIAAVVVSGVVLLNRKTTHPAAAVASKTVDPAVSSAARASAVDTLTGVGGLAGATPLSSVQAAAPNTTLTSSQLTSGGILRSYLVVAPVNQTGPLPVIVMLHGQNASVAAQSISTQLLPLASAGQAILVFPAGFLQSWNVEAQGCCGKSVAAGTNDVSFISAVVSAVRKTYSVAAGKMFLVGFSNGGKMAYDVMCKDPRLFDGFAAIAATPLATCSSSSIPPRSTLISVGSADPELPTTGTHQDPATLLAATAAIWRKNDSCDAVSTAQTEGTATITTWSACLNATTVQTAIYAGQGHAWPGATPDGTPGAAGLIWSFFSSLS